MTFSDRRASPRPPPPAPSLRRAPLAWLARSRSQELPRLAWLLARLIPPGDRESIVGDLIEDAALRDLAGARRSLWLAGECAAIAGGLSIQRARGWLVVPPVREVVSGLAVDGRGAFRGSGAAGTLLRAALFCGSVATLVLGVEVLVGSLLSAAGL